VWENAPGSRRGACAQRERFADGVICAAGGGQRPSLIPIAITQSLHLTLSGAPEALLFAYLVRQDDAAVLDNVSSLRKA
jgi:hypothetical protein